jgi:hypothetical protein
VCSFLGGCPPRTVYHASMQGVTDIVAALAQWTTDASRLIGVFESQELEFKKVAYRLGDDEGKSEFAKDVCAMANAGGGLIILGVETERDPTVGRDVSVRVRPLASDSISTSQTEDVARTWIYPPQRALTIREWPDDASGKMLVSIEVPNLSDPGGLALILGPGSPPDRRTVGVPIRSEARVDFHLAPELYDWIRRGRSQSVPSNDEVSSAATTQAAEDQLERVRVDSSTLIRQATRSSTFKCGLSSPLDSMASLTAMVFVVSFSIHRPSGMRASVGGAFGPRSIQVEASVCRVVKSLIG